MTVRDDARIDAPTSAATPSPGLRVTPDLDVTDAQGTPRLSLTSGDAGGGRIAAAAGVILRDRQGKERGGMATLDLAEGSRLVVALDHPGGEAIGFMVGDEGAAGFHVNDALGAGRAPQARRINLGVSPDGTPALELQDSESRPRLRLTLTDDGAGVIEFVDALGHVVTSICPEHELSSRT